MGDSIIAQVRYFITCHFLFTSLCLTHTHKWHLKIRLYGPELRYLPSLHWLQDNGWRVKQLNNGRMNNEEKNGILAAVSVFDERHATISKTCS